MAKFEKGKFINVGNHKSSSSSPSNNSDDKLDEIIEKIIIHFEQNLKLSIIYLLEYLTPDLSWMI